MKVPFVLKSIAASMLLCYVSASFIVTDMNPEHWSSATRHFTVIASWVLGISYSIINHMTKNNN